MTPGLGVFAFSIPTPVTGQWVPKGIGITAEISATFHEILNLRTLSRGPRLPQKQLLHIPPGA